MLQYMLEAKVGDDVFKQDPSMISLEQKVATMFGKEKGMFFPSGTMSNQVAVGLNTNPGDQLICDTHTHIYHYEAGGASANWGVSCHLVHGDKGRLRASQIESKINNKSFYHTPLKPNWYVSKIPAIEQEEHITNLKISLKSTPYASNMICIYTWMELEFGMP